MTLLERMKVLLYVPNWRIAEHAEKFVLLNDRNVENQGSLNLGTVSQYEYSLKWCPHATYFLPVAVSNLMAIFDWLFVVRSKNLLSSLY